MKHISFDDKIDLNLKKIQNNLKQMGIKNVSKTDALRFALEMNNAAQLKFKREPKKKWGFIFY
jgi:hypothetical protein